MASAVEIDIIYLSWVLVSAPRLDWVPWWLRSSSSPTHGGSYSTLCRRRGRYTREEALCAKPLAPERNVSKSGSNPPLSGRWVLAAESRRTHRHPGRHEWCVMCAVCSACQVHEWCAIANVFQNVNYVCVSGAFHVFRSHESPGRRKVCSEQWSSTTH